MIAPVKSLSLKIDAFSEGEWDCVVSNFQDGNFYQTSAYGAVHWPNRQLVRVAIYEGDQLVGAAQVCVAKLPFLGGGVAYLRWGPMFRPFGQSSGHCLSRLRSVLTVLRDEFAVKRRCSLVVLPNVFEDIPSAAVVRDAYTNLGFKRVAENRPYRTIRLDLRASQEELHKRLKQRWRRQLNKACRSDLELARGTALELFDEFLVLYKEMMQRKKFFTYVEEDEFREMQQRLEDGKKLKVLVARSKGKAVSAIVVSLMGDTGLYLLGATGDTAVGMEASYLLHWEMLKELRAEGAAFYDLGGIDPDVNPGVYQFKRGMSGQDESFCPEFRYDGALLPSLFVKLRSALMRAVRKLRS